MPEKIKIEVIGDNASEICSALHDLLIAFGGEPMGSPEPLSSDELAQMLANQLAAEGKDAAVEIVSPKPETKKAKAKSKAKPKTRGTRVRDETPDVAPELEPEDEPEETESLADQEAETEELEKDNDAMTDAIDILMDVHARGNKGEGRAAIKDLLQSYGVATFSEMDSSLGAELLEKARELDKEVPA